MTVDEYRESMRGRTRRELLDEAAREQAAALVACASFDFVEGGKRHDAVSVLSKLLQDSRDADPAAFDAEVSAWNAAHGREP